MFHPVLWSDISAMSLSVATRIILSLALNNRTWTTAQKEVATGFGQELSTTTTSTANTLCPNKKGSNLSYEDPFATAPATADVPQQDEAQQQTVPTQAPAQAPAAVSAARESVSVQHSTDGVSATFKFGGQYSDPWVVVKGADAAEVHEKLYDPKFKELMDRVQFIASQYGSASPTASKPANGGGGGGGQQSRAPQGATQAPNGETRYCEHGEMVYKSGISKAGNPYKLFSCTAPRDKQCKAQYLNDKK